MPQYMFALPEDPPFPVFGLGPQFDGFRWLIIWNDQQNFHTVTLGHGHPDSGSWIAVSTYLKTPQRQVGGGLTIGPTGLSDAYLDAVTRLAQVGLAHDEQAQHALIALALSEAPVEGTPTFGAEWSTHEGVIDAQPHPCRTRHVAGAWATVVDLPTVAIAISGPDSITATAWPLTNVNAGLDQYL